MCDFNSFKITSKRNDNARYQPQKSVLYSQELAYLAS